MTKSLSYFLYLCDCSLPYCASLEAWNCVVAGQLLNASHPRSTLWPNANKSIFPGVFLKTINCCISPTVGVFDLVPKLTARHHYQLSYGSKYINVILFNLHRHYLNINTTQSFMDNPSYPQSDKIKY